MAGTVRDVNDPPLFSFTKRSKMALGNGKLVFRGAMWVLQGTRKHAAEEVCAHHMQGETKHIEGHNHEQSDILHASHLLSAGSVTGPQELSDEA